MTTLDQLIDQADEHYRKAMSAKFERRRREAEVHRLGHLVLTARILYIAQTGVVPLIQGDDRGNFFA